MSRKTTLESFGTSWRSRDNQLSNGGGDQGVVLRIRRTWTFFWGTLHEIGPPTPLTDYFCLGKRLWYTDDTVRQLR